MYVTFYYSNIRNSNLTIEIRHGIKKLNSTMDYFDGYQHIYMYRVTYVYYLIKNIDYIHLTPIQSSFRKYIDKNKKDKLVIGENKNLLI